jgi:ABC-type polysaccharide/polyol phosphate transport system, ATPase component
MNSDILIQVEGLSKKFCRSLRRSMYYGTMDITRSMLNIPFDKGILRKNEFWALDNINFELKKGETLGLIGRNGCGKSTLLRIINGIFPPDRGRVSVKGRIGALIAVGAGFHPNMTGKENIFLNGTILGMSRQEINKKFDSILDFAELKEFIDAPVSTYSSGMNIRLGFSIAIHANTDILLVDEILAVGDVGFQIKCYEVLAKLIKNGTALLFVSHDLNSVQRFCNKAIWLEKGHIREHDKVEKVVNEYRIQSERDTYKNISTLDFPLEQENKNVNTNLVEVRGVKFFDYDGEERTFFEYNNYIKIRIEFEINNVDINEVCVSLTMKTLDGKYFSGYSSTYDHCLYKVSYGANVVNLVFPNFYFGAGIYAVNVGIWDTEYRGCYDWKWEGYSFEIHSTNRLMIGRIELPHEWYGSDNTRLLKLEKI